MFSTFLSYMRSHAGLSSEELELICSKAQPLHMHRKDLLLKEEDICRHKTFISKGMLRTYRTKDDGSEHILQFNPENSWAIDPESYDNVAPSLYNIEALEDSDVLRFNKEDFSYLLKAIPALQLFSQRLISSNIYSSRQRLFSSISSTAEEKYEEFLSTQPEVAARVPLHMIAAYLGVTRETLSRVRKAKING